MCTAWQPAASAIWDGGFSLNSQPPLHDTCLYSDSIQLLHTHPVTITSFIEDTILGFTNCSMQGFNQLAWLFHREGSMGNAEREEEYTEIGSLISWLCRGLPI